MPMPERPEEEIRRVFALYAEAVAKGYPPIGVAPRRGEKGAARVVNDALQKRGDGYVHKCVAAAEKRFGLKLAPLGGATPSIAPNDYDARRAALKGEAGFDPVLAGFQIAAVSTNTKTGAAWVRQKPEPGEAFEPPAGHAVKGVSALVDPDGRTLAKWVKTREGAIDPTAFAAECAEAFRDFSPAAPAIVAPSRDFSDELAVYPFADPHFGLMVWGKEARDNWNLKIAERAFREAFAEIIARTPAARRALLIVGGDTLHADDNRNITPQGGNFLSVDGRHQKVFLVACQTLAEIGQMLLGNHEQVEIVVLPGNHDPTSAAPISYFLHAWFRSEPRIAVDTSPSYFRFRKHGAVMLGMAHGHKAKASKLPEAMAAYADKMWGETKFRYGHTFHTHHDETKTFGGCIVEQHQILSPADEYAFSHAYLAGRSQKSITYCPKRGQSGRAYVNL